MDDEEMKRLMKRYEALLREHPSGAHRPTNREIKAIKERFANVGLRIGTDMTDGMVIIFLPDSN
jgi:hypothetical protein